MSSLGRIKRSTAFQVSVGVALVGLTTSHAVSQEREPSTDEDPLVIGAIDFYGLRTTSVAEVRELLPFNEGDARVPDSGFLSEDLKVRVAEALDVSRVAMSVVCCLQDGKAIIFVGVEETPAPSVAYFAPPSSEIELPDEVLWSAAAADDAYVTAVRNGDYLGDSSEGHSLANNREVRILQERFVGFAETYWDTLIDVLHTSARPGHRAIAAQVIAYGTDKAAVASHLERAVLDPAVGVRNNATAALAIIAVYANEHPELEIEILPDVFIDMLNSIEWLDRNKGASILSILTQSRDLELMTELRARALPSLIEMCSWKSEDHAFSSCVMLERILGLPEQNELHPKDRTIVMASELLQ